MFCKNCGQQLEENVAHCTNCGAPVAAQPPVAPQAPEVAQPEDKGGFLWGLLGCCVPLAGLILFLIWKDSKPKTAKAAIIGAAVGFGLSILSSILTYVVGIGAAAMGGMY